jgi:hypothetical protein
MSALFSDDFNRANGSVGADWTATLGLGAGGSPQIASNQVNAGGVDAGAFNNSVVYPNDQYAQAVIGGERQAVGVRCTAVGGEIDTYYFFTRLSDGAIAINKYTNNVGAANITTGTASLNIGDTIYLQISGTSLTAKVNGVTVLTGSDGSFASGSAMLWVGSTGGDGIIDNFESGNLDAAALDDYDWQIQHPQPDRSPVKVVAY